MEKLEHLRLQLDCAIRDFRRESEKHKGMYRNARYLTFGLAATATLLGGLALTFPAWQQGLNLLIVGVTTTAGVVTSYEGLRKPAELWIHERTVYHQLRDLARELEYRVCSGDPDPREIDEYFAHLQALLGASVDKWQKHIGPQAGKPG